MASDELALLRKQIAPVSYATVVSNSPASEGLQLTNHGPDTAPTVECLQPTEDSCNVLIFARKGNDTGTHKYAREQNDRFSATNILPSLEPLLTTNSIHDCFRVDRLGVIVNGHSW